jgi:hypothetical protein
MTRKLMIIIIPSLILILSVAIMAGGTFLKQPFGEDDRIYEGMKSLEKDVKTKNWKQAKHHLDYSQKAWEKIVNRIQFSAEREYMLEISGALSRIKGGIEAEDDKAILEEIYFFYSLWEDLGT